MRLMYKKSDTPIYREMGLIEITTGMDMIGISPPAFQAQGEPLFLNEAIAKKRDPSRFFLLGRDSYL